MEKSSPEKASGKSTVKPAAGVLLYTALAFGISWALWVPRMLNAELPAAGSLGILGSFGPSLAASISVLFLQGPGKVGALLKKLVHFRFPFWLYLFILGLGPVIGAVVYAISTGLLGYTFDSMFLKEPAIIPLGFFYILALGGPLGEELGWRGYLQEKGEDLAAPFYAALGIGAVWALWHLPLFFTPGTVQSAIPFWQFLLQSVVLAVLYTWVNWKSGGSVFAAILFHTSLNFAMGLFPLFQHFVPVMLGFLGLAVAAAILVVTHRGFFFHRRG